MFLILCTYCNILVLMRQSVQVIVMSSPHHCCLFINLLTYTTMKELWVMLARHATLFKRAGLAGYNLGLGCDSSHQTP